MKAEITEYDLVMLNQNNSKAMAALSAAAEMIATGASNYDVLIDIAMDYTEANSDMLNKII